MQAQFIEDVKQFLSESAVVTDASALQAVTATNKSFTKVCDPIAILYPTTVEDVQKIVKAAIANQINIVPTSSADGADRFTGGSLPAEGTTSAIVNLCRMKKIIRIDRRNKMAIVEAGVTFKELNEAAKEYGLCIDQPLQVRDTKSIAATLLDRDPTMIPRNQWDVADPLACMECVMGTGEIFRTGSAAGPGTLEEQWASGVAQNNPLGPGWLDLGRVVTGSQGTLAIITWISVRLQLIPEKTKVLYAQSDDIKAIEPVVYGNVRRRNGDEFVILNGFALASMVKNLKGEIELMADALPKWTMITRVSGYNFFTDLKFKQQETDAKALAESVGCPLVDEIDEITSKDVMELLDDTVVGNTWKTRYKGQSIDIFFLSTLDRAQDFVDIVESTLEAKGIDKELVGIYLQPVQMSRACQIEFVIPYADKEQAAKLEDELLDKLIAAGAFFSRPYGAVVDKAFAVTPAQKKNAIKIKELFDPKNVLNKGKLFYGEAK